MRERWVDELVPEGDVTPEFERELRARLADAWPSQAGRSSTHGRRRVIATVSGIAAAVALFVLAIGWVGGSTRPRLTPSTEPVTAPTDPPAPTTTVVLDVAAMREQLKGSEWVSVPDASTGSMQPGWLRFNQDLSEIDGFTGCQAFSVNNGLQGDRVVLDKPVLGGGSCGPTLAYLANGDQLQVVVGGLSTELHVLHDGRLTYRLMSLLDLSPVEPVVLPGSWTLWNGTLLTFAPDGTVDLGGCPTIGRWATPASGSVRLTTTATADDVSACAGLAADDNAPIMAMFADTPAWVSGAEGGMVLMDAQGVRLWMARYGQLPDVASGLDVAGLKLWGLRMGRPVSQSVVERVVQHALASVTTNGIAPTEHAAPRTFRSLLVSCSGGQGVVLGFGGFSVILSTQPTDVTVVGWMLGADPSQQAALFDPPLLSLDDEVGSLLGSPDQPSLRLGLSPAQVQDWWRPIANRFPGARLVFHDASGAEVSPEAASTAEVVDASGMTMMFTFTDGHLTWIAQTVC